MPNKEYNDWHKLVETDSDLEKRVHQYCADLGFDQFDDIVHFQWSATFISWCFLRAGAANSEFHFSPAHAVFVYHAIKNAEAGGGVFRGHRITDYAPKLGDLIHRNQPKGNIAFEYARKNADYHSHSAIVVDFIVENGVRYAVTIGGNEGQSVGKRQVALTAEGKVKQVPKAPYISVVENLKQNVGGAGVSEPADDPAIPFAIPILHPLLENDPELRWVAAREKTLSPTGEMVSGVGSVQDALELLWRDHPEYEIDLGPNRKLRGYYGTKTARALREFQHDHGIEESGNIDYITLSWLSKALNELKFEEEIEHEIGATGEIVFTLRRDERKWYATAAGGPEFFVGKAVRFGPPKSSKERRGLMNDGYEGYKFYYDPESPEAQSLGHWRYVLAPTVECESGNMLSCINTYDKAYFTFGCYQFAAHVPKGDFVRWLRALLRQVDSAPQYFPDLTLNDQGNIARRVNGGLRDLEVTENGETRELMRYFNPSDEAVEEREVLNCARFIHWNENNAQVRHLQMVEAVNTAKEKMFEQNTAHPFKQTLHPDPLDFLCVAIIDIIHHEGSRYDKINSILKSKKDPTDALEALCAAGRDGERNEKLLHAIVALIKDNKLGVQHWSDLKA